MIGLMAFFGCLWVLLVARLDANLQLLLKLWSVPVGEKDNGIYAEPFFQQLVRHTVRILSDTRCGVLGAIRPTHVEILAQRQRHRALCYRHMV